MTRTRAHDAAHRRALTDDDSRAASNALLDGLREQRFGPAAWGRFAVDTTARSILEARKRPRAVVEATAVHAAMAALAHPRGRAWVLTSWLMTPPAAVVEVIMGARAIGRLVSRRGDARLERGGATA